MALSTCWRCLFRASETAHLLLRSSYATSRLQNPASTVAFSTTSTLNALSIQQKSGRPNAPPTRGVKATYTPKKKKKPPPEKGKAPAVGERKALRKRIVLSNTNALEVQGMEDISVESMLDESSQGKVFGIPGPVVDQLRAVDAFKVSQGWRLFRRPAMLVRNETFEYAKMIEKISAEDNKKTVRRVLVGERGSGKSLMQLQAMTMAFLKGWTVINIPEGTFTFPLSKYPRPRANPFPRQPKTSQSAILPTLPYPALPPPSTPNQPTPPPFSPASPAQTRTSPPSPSPNPPPPSQSPPPHPSPSLASAPSQPKTPTSPPKSSPSSSPNSLPPAARHSCSA